MAANLGDQGLELLLEERVEACRGFVEDQQLRFVHEGIHEPDLLSVARRVLLDPAIEIEVEPVERFVGNEVQLKLRVPLAGRRNFSGLLLGVADGRIRLRADTGEVEFELAGIDKARLVPRFD